MKLRVRYFYRLDRLFYSSDKGRKRESSSLPKSFIGSQGGEGGSKHDDQSKKTSKKRFAFTKSPLLKASSSPRSPKLLPKAGSEDLTAGGNNGRGYEFSDGSLGSPDSNCGSPSVNTPIPQSPSFIQRSLSTLSSPLNLQKKKRFKER